VVGAVVDGQDTTKICWVVEEVVEAIIPVEEESGGSDFERFILRHVDCDTDTDKLTNGLCPQCEKKKNHIMFRIGSNINVRREPFEPKIHLRKCIGERTLSLNNLRVDYYEKEKKSLVRKLRKKRKSEVNNEDVGGISGGRGGNQTLPEQPGIFPSTAFKFR
jgi:hypothetical protein